MIITKTSDSIPYTLKNDSSVTFQLKALSKREFVKFGIAAQSAFSDSSDGISQDQADFMYDTIKANVVGFSGIIDEDGKDIPFKKIALVLDNMEFEYITELFQAVTEVNTISESESKNSK